MKAKLYKKINKYDYMTVRNCSCNSNFEVEKASTQHVTRPTFMHVIENGIITIIRRRRGDYRGIFTETKSR